MFAFEETSTVIDESEKGTKLYNVNTLICARDDGEWLNATSDCEENNLYFN